MGEGARFLDDAMQKNMEALNRAKQSARMVQKIVSKKSQVAQVTTGKKK